MAMVAAVFMVPLAGSAHTEGEPFTVDLLAGRNATDVGDVEVWNDADYLYVDYKITDSDWCLTETHVDVEMNAADIPQTKKNNPIPGKFEYSAVHDCVSEYGYMIPMTWDAGIPVVIAAHSKVVKGSAVGMYWATDQSDANQGLRWDGTSVLAARSDPEDVLGVPDAVGPPFSGFYSLGFGGTIVVDFGAPIYNGVGDDLGGVEVTGGTYPEESARVEFLYDGLWYEADDELTNNGSTALQRTTFVDMPAGIPYADAARITDTTDPNLFNTRPTADGFDVDAVKVSQLVTDMETAWGEGNNFGGKQWGMWFNYTIQGVLIETIMVPSDGSLVTSAALVDGDSYELRASGTYRFANWGAAGIADAQCSYRIAPHVPSSYPLDSNGAAWVNGNDLDVLYPGFESWLEVWAGDILPPGPVDWDPGTCQPDNMYTRAFTAESDPVSFRIMDTAYGDNSGYITVEIWWMFDS